MRPGETGCLALAREQVTFRKWFAGFSTSLHFPLPADGGQPAHSVFVFSLLNRLHDNEIRGRIYNRPPIITGVAWVLLHHGRRHDELGQVGGLQSVQRPRGDGA